MHLKSSIGLETLKVNCPTNKPSFKQQDLKLAYSPGVEISVLEIGKDAKLALGSVKFKLP